MQKKIVYLLTIICVFLIQSAFAHQDVVRLHFFENKGQWPENVKYRADITSGFVFMENKSLIFSFYDNQNPHFFHPYRPVSQQTYPNSANKVHCRAYRLSFVGALDTRPTHSQARSKEYRNYFLGQRAASHVFGYDTVYYPSLYQGIDMRIYQGEYDLKYDFEVKAGVSTAQINMQYSGVDTLFLRYGNLYIVSGTDTVIELKPVSYQKKGKKWVEVPTEFDLQGNTVGFVFPQGYDTSQDLLIDPLLVFSSFSGSTSDNWGNTAGFDSLGNLYAGGTVFGANFPTTVGSFDVDFNGEVDVAIIKYDTDKQTKLYATFFGGSQVDIPVSIICDSDQNLVMLGLTASRNLPVFANSYRRTHAGGNNVTPISGYEMIGGSDLFVAILSQEGTQLKACTYLGGNGSDGISLHPTINKNYGDAIRMEVILDKQNHPYVIYASNSTNLSPTNTFGSQSQGSVFVQKLSADLSQSLWLVSIGSSGRETGCSIRLKDKKLLIGGSTTGTDFPLTPNAAQKNYAGGVSDGFVALLDAEKGDLLAGTYVGTSGYDKVFYVDFDPNSNDIFCFGQTDGRFVVSRGVYSNPKSGQFLMRLDADLSQVLTNTVLGSGDGTPDFVPTGFQVSRCNNINITGWASNALNTNTLETTEDDGFVGGSTKGLPTTSDAFIPNSPQDSSDFYFMVVSVAMDKLIYATFFGGTQGSGEHVDGGTSRFSEDGTVYQAVCACRSRDRQGTAPNIPTTDGSSMGNSQNCNNMAFKFDLGVPTARFTASKNSGCAPLTATFSAPKAQGIRFTWEIDGLLRQTSPNNTPLTHTFSKPGKYVVRYTVENPNYCSTVAVFADTIRVFDIDYQVIGDTVLCIGESTTLQVQTEGSVEWLAPLNVNAFSVTLKPQQTSTYRFKITKGEQCLTNGQVKVEVVPPIVPNIKVYGDGDCGEMPFLVAKNQTPYADEFVWSINGEILRTKEIDAHMLPDTGCFVIGFSAKKAHCQVDTTFDFCIERLVLPNFISPNGDGLNEQFDINARYGPHKIVIVNRWGRIVYQSENYQNEWSAEGLPPGVYYYSLTPPSGRVCKGWIMVEK